MGITFSCYVCRKKAFLFQFSSREYPKYKVWRYQYLTKVNLWRTKNNDFRQEISYNLDIWLCLNPLKDCSFIKLRNSKLWILWGWDLHFPVFVCSVEERAKQGEAVKQTKNNLWIFHKNTTFTLNTGERCQREQYFQGIF